MQIKNIIGGCFIVVIGLILSACGDKQKSDQAQHYVKQIKQEAASKKQVKPTLPVIKKERYQQIRSRSPFEQSYTKKQKQAHPDTILNNYSLESLKLIGILIKSGKKWAIITTPDGKIVKVTKGSRVGSHHNLVTKITNSQILFVEDDNPDKPETTLTIQESK